MPNPTTLQVDWDSSNTDFDQIYNLNVGEVFKFTKDIETINAKITERIPNTLSKFKATLITPGSPYYTIYGVNSFIVTEKEEVPVP